MKSIPTVQLVREGRRALKCSRRLPHEALPKTYVGNAVSWNTHGVAMTSYPERLCTESLSDHLNSSHPSPLPHTTNHHSNCKQLLPPPLHLPLRQLQHLPPPPRPHPPPPLRRHSRQRRRCPPRHLRPPLPQPPPPRRPLPGLPHPPLLPLLTLTTTAAAAATSFDLRQETYPGDPYGGVSREVLPTFHAYAKSGTAVGPAAYANYGRAEDFAALRRMRVDVAGAVVVARYGKVYRGDIVRNAAEAGAAGVVVFSDRKDYGGSGDGDGGGGVFPEGRWMPRSGVQVGSVYRGAGDPTTPGWGSVVACERVGKEEVERGRGGGGDTVFTGVRGRMGRR
ncbi:hypothetical protein Sjap_019540 [Stephania japonica]|uniref:PA domain-containing protein n=1 Tax=Stephania japonica TaxID=461633 RepID=A0AAP0HZG0_9MAGN